MDLGSGSALLEAPHWQQGPTTGQQASPMLCKVLKQLLSGVSMVVEKPNYLAISDSEQMFPRSLRT